MNAPLARQCVWAPAFESQRRLLSCPVYEVFFGGARGGGKTDGMLGDWIQHSATCGSRAIGLMVRRTSTQLQETIERARQILVPLGATITSQPANCRMPNGARLNFRYLERDEDAENYQGHSYTRVYIEEAGNFPSPAPIMKLHATLRSGSGIPCRMRLTGNPGGPGHHWLKSRYIDVAPPHVPYTDPETGLERVFIPSRVSDNTMLNQAAYIAQLKQSGSPELVRAWLEGDWDAIAGAFFPEFTRARHVIAPRELPAYWTRYMAMDWGSARPFAVYWIAVSDGELQDIPRGALVVYREWYGSNGQPNVGLRMTAEEVALGIKQRTGDDKVTWIHADPAMFSEDGGPSIAERMMRAAQLPLTRADNRRVQRLGALGGWDQVRARLKGGEAGPGILFFDTCRDIIRTLPALQHDPDRPEDVDSDAEDHGPDAVRYGCMARPYVTDEPVLPKPKFDFGDGDASHIDIGVSVMDLIKRAEKARRRLD